MGKRNRYAPKQRLEIVLEGLRGETSVTELCRKHGITSTMYYKWRDLFLRKGEEIFANRGNFASEQAYIDKIRRMERIYKYNHERIHSGLNYLTPVEFREGWFQKQDTGVAQNQFLKVDEGFDTQVKLHLDQLVEVS